MSRYTIVMLGGMAMASIMGALMIGWLALNEGSGFVGLLFITGMLVGVAVFAGSAAEALRHADDDTGSGRPHAAEETHWKRDAIR